MSTRLLLGDCRETLPTLASCSVQACITSPPYYGLRDYGLPPLVWGGDAECEHKWQPANSTRRIYTEAATEHGERSIVGSKLHEGQMGRANALPGDVCPCGAWLGSLGLEPTPDSYVEHMVEVFRHVRRVLRDDGVLWLNLGDSYAGSGNGSNDHRAADASPSMRQVPRGERSTHSRLTGGKTTVDVSLGGNTAPGLKAKDLMMMPFRVAMALQNDGWYLRSVIPWLKRNSMPESVSDRPSTSVEYVFLLAKSQRYYYDAEAIRTESLGTWNDGGFRNGHGGYIHDGSFINSGGGEEHRQQSRSNQVAGRNRRNSDWFFESWQGLMLDEDDDPLALVVNPAPFKGSHFATFPTKLVEPMIKASTRPGDTILDCFGGAGTVGLVADRLQRNAVLCELSEAYAPMATERIVGDAPLFVEMVAD